MVKVSDNHVPFTSRQKLDFGIINVISQNCIYPPQNIRKKGQLTFLASFNKANELTKSIPEGARVHYT